MSVEVDDESDDEVEVEEVDMDEEDVNAQQQVAQQQVTAAAPAAPMPEAAVPEASNAAAPAPAASTAAATSASASSQRGTSTAIPAGLAAAAAAATTDMDCGVCTSCLAMDKGGSSRKRKVCLVRLAFESRASSRRTQPIERFVASPARGSLPRAFASDGGAPPVSSAMSRAENLVCPKEMCRELQADEEATKVWAALMEVEAARDDAERSVETEHGTWTIRYKLRLPGQRGGKPGDFYVSAPEDDGSIRWSHASAIRSWGALYEVLQMRYEARRDGRAVFQTPSSYELIDVEVEDEHTAPGEPQWRTAHVTRTLPDGRFQVCVHKPDGTADPKFLEWYDRRTEEVEWSRRDGAPKYDGGGKRLLLEHKPSAEDRKPVPSKPAASKPVATKSAAGSMHNETVDGFTFCCAPTAAALATNSKASSKPKHAAKPPAPQSPPPAEAQPDGVQLHLSSRSATGYMGVHQTASQINPFIGIYSGKYLGCFPTAIAAAVAYAEHVASLQLAGGKEAAAAVPKPSERAANATDVAAVSVSQSGKELPPGWTAEKHVAPSGTYNTYSNGECRARTKAQAWEMYNLEYPAATGTPAFVASCPVSSQAPPAVSPPSAATAGGGLEGMAEVRDMLERFRLSMYADKFDEQGYDDRDYLLTMEAAQIDGLITDVGMKPGHAVKFRDFLALERRAAPAP